MPKEIVIIGPPGTGKCVDLDTYCLTSDGLLKVRDLVESLPGPGRTIPLEELSVPGILGVRKAAELYDGGQKPVIRAQTRKGFEIVGTSEHPILAICEGQLAWKRLSALRAGDRVAVAAGTMVFPEEYPKLQSFHDVSLHSWKVPVPFKQKVSIPEFMNDDLAEWLGWFIGEGCWNGTKQNSGIGFCNFSAAVVRRMEHLTEALFSTKLKEGDPNNYRTGSLRVKRWLGIMGAAGLAAEKQVPYAILRSPESCQRSFLRAIFEAEGSIGLDRRQIEFCSASIQLCRQIQLMLLNFGVVAARFPKVAETQRWGRRTYWRLSFTGNQLLVFRERLGFMEGGEKQAALNSVQVGLRGWDLHGLPVEFVQRRYRELRDYMESMRDERPREFWRAAKTVVRSLSGSRPESQKVVARSTMEKGLRVFSDYSQYEPFQDLRNELDSGRFWDEVVERETFGIRPVADLVVPEGNSFVGNGIVCHNTTACIQVASGWFKDGCGPDQVAYLAFTKAAANEAASRIKDEKLDLGLDAERLPFFRTLHSLAYSGLKKAKEDIRLVTTADMKLFSNWAGLDGTFQVDEWEDVSEVYQRLAGGGRTRWDDCLTAYTISRISASTPEQLKLAKTRTSRKANALMGRCFEEPEYKEFVAKYEAYKTANGLVDFTDMLEFALCEMDPVDSVRFVVVDELQDNAAILHALVEKLFCGAEELWLAGDVNQCIFSFAAADPKLFMQRAQRAAHRIVLPQTHRFGQEVVDFSTQIINRAQDKIVVDVKGHPGVRHSIRGTGSFQPRVEDMLILHRHVAGCQALAAAYIASGLPFRNERGKDPLGYDKRVVAFQALYDLASGGEVAAGAVSRLVDDMMPSKLQPEPGMAKGARLVVYGAKKRLQDGAIKGHVRLQDLIEAKILTSDGADLVRSGHYQAFNHADDLEYYRRVIENGYSLDKDGKIPHITTIHGSKGREAPSVAVFTEMSRKCWQDVDSEHRLAYVASTRTQGDLEICEERTVEWAYTKYNYPSQKPPLPKAEKAEDIDFDAI